MLLLIDIRIESTGMACEVLMKPLSIRVNKIAKTTIIFYMIEE